MNQILLLKIKAGIVEPLKGLVKWDRYCFNEKMDAGFIFGWLSREDGHYDFVVVRFCIAWNMDGKLLWTYDTSSKKYSKEIGIRMNNRKEINDYHACKPAGEILDDESLVHWQKTGAKAMLMSQSKGNEVHGHVPS